MNRFAILMVLFCCSVTVAVPAPRPRNPPPPQELIVGIWEPVDKSDDAVYEFASDGKMTITYPSRQPRFGTYAIEKSFERIGGLDFSYHVYDDCTSAACQIKSISATELVIVNRQTVYTFRKRAAEKP